MPDGGGGGGEEVFFKDGKRIALGQYLHSG